MADKQQNMDEVYRRRAALAGKYDLANPGNAFNLDKLTIRLSAMLTQSFGDLSAVKLLDLGAGELFWPALMTDLGLDLKNCIGSDLLHWRLATGHQKGRDIAAVAADSAQLPFRSETFDLISQFTLMTSVLDETARTQIASEMLSVLKPGGYILWYDFRYNNPANKDTRAIGRREVQSLFQSLPVVLETVTLMPPLARKIPRPLTPLLKFLYIFPMLRSHYLALIGPKG